MEERLTATTVDSLVERLTRALKDRCWNETVVTNQRPARITGRNLRLEEVARTSINIGIALSDSDGTLLVYEHSGTTFTFTETGIIIRCTADSGDQKQYNLEFIE